MIAALAVGALLAPHGSWSRVTRGPARSPAARAFGAMVLAALWAYDGWNNLPMAAGEVRDPARNLPRAIVGGALGVLAIYALVNIGYFHALPLAEIVGGEFERVPRGAGGRARRSRRSSSATPRRRCSRSRWRSRRCRR